MSDNSIIFITKSKGKYTITHADSESNVTYSKVTTLTALDALQKAQEMQDETYPEYGIHINIKEDL